MEKNSIIGFICLGVGLWLIFGNSNLFSIKAIGTLIAFFGLIVISNHLKFK